MAPLQGAASTTTRPKYEIDDLVALIRELVAEVDAHATGRRLAAVRRAADSLRPFAGGMLDTPAAAEALGLSVASIYSYRSRGSYFPAVDFQEGGIPRWFRETITEYRDSKRSEGCSAQPSSTASTSEAPANRPAMKKDPAKKTAAEKRKEYILNQKAPEA